MALLDALTYIIEADASQLDRQIKESDGKVMSLQKNLKNVEDQAQKSRMTFNTLAKAAFGYFGAFLSVTKAVSLANDRMSFVGGLNDVAAAANIAIDDVDAFGKSLESIGGTAEQANATLTNVALNIGRALNEVDGRQAKVFSALGINLKDTTGQARATMDIFLDLSDALAGMDRGQATARLAQLGITDVKSIELILKGRKEIEAMIRSQKAQGVVTKESAQAAAKYEEALIKLRAGYQRSKDAIADMLIPAVTWLVEKFGSVVNWANKHKTVLVTFFSTIATVLTVMYLPAMVKAAAATWALISPFLAIATPIAAVAALIALLVDDVMAYMDGNNSLIGQILGEFPIIGDVVDTVINSVIAAFHAASAILSLFWNGAQMMVNGVVKAFKSLGNSVSIVFRFISDTVGAAFDFIGKVWQKISGVFTKVAQFLGFGGGEDVNIDVDKKVEAAIPKLADMDAQLAEAEKQMQQVNTNPMNSVAPGTISKTQNITKEQKISIGAITIQTQATDAASIVQDINSQLLEQLKSLQAESASGVAG